ncbi:MAG TPA: type II secretion system protein GspD [Candidatus Paceibacterota bacterium]|nr:type II secretion system protein GspD [Verrucomicrobiota bacterium]HOX00948.1 type II secretion system protein GspD [Verrucomicrobiota bacterium]HRZ43786.1 type II secretion system protein GspD [Candidatus Paceibacterota bacterium]
MAELTHVLRWLALPLLWLALTACQRTEVTSGTPAKSRPAATRERAASTASRTTSPGASESRRLSRPVVPTIKRPAVSDAHQAEIGRILGLARESRWAEAESRVRTLYAQDSKDSAVVRLYNWVITEAARQRQRALEESIREVTAEGDTRLNPNAASLFTDKKSQSLPPRSDLRDEIERLKAEPYIPENYGRTVQSRGQLEDFNSPRGRMNQLLDKEVEVHLDNVTLENIIFNLGSVEGVNFVADRSIPAFQQKLSVNMTKVRLGEFLAYVSRNLGVQFQVGGDLIWITDAKNTNQVYRETRFFRLRRGFVMPAQFGVSEASRTTTRANNVTTVTEVQKYENFVRDGAPAQPSIEEAIRNFFTGEYFIDYERNVIVAEGTSDQLAVMEKIVEEFDQPIRQVLIEARFITVAESTFLKLGVAWETGRSRLSGRSTATDYTGMSPTPTGLGIEEVWYGVLGRDTLSATLTMLEQSGESETLSAPRVTVVNNLPATISDGKVQYYYEQYDVSQTATQYRSTSSLVPSGKPMSIIAGVSLDVLASVGAGGRTIYLALNPEVSQDVQLKTFATVSDVNDQGKVISTFDIRLPEARRQSLATRVVVQSGQTVVMGGVLQREQKTFVESVPVLSNIPILGAAFRRREEVDRPRYLLVFVTATVLSEDGEFLVRTDAE